MLSLFDAFPPATVVLLLATALVAGLARGFSGFGGALIFVPLASTVVGPQIAAPLILLVDSLGSLGMVPEAWRRANRRDVGTMAAGALVGVPAGTWLLTHSDPVALRWGIAILTATLLAVLVSGWRYRGRPAAPLTMGVGGVAGVFGGVAQVSGPPIVAYWLGGSIPPVTVRANLVLYFFVASLITVTSYLVGGLLTGRVLALALLTGPVYSGGVYLGSRLFRGTDEGLFRRICYVLIGGAALVSLPVLDGWLR